MHIVLEQILYNTYEPTIQHGKQVPIYVLREMKLQDLVPNSYMQQNRWTDRE